MKVENIKYLQYFYYAIRRIYGMLMPKPTALV